MNPIKWLERKLYLGEVVQDYGCISERRVGVSRERVTVLLCKRGGKLFVVFRHSAFAYLAASVGYSFVPVSSLSRLKEIVDDIASRTA